VLDFAPRIHDGHPTAIEVGNVGSRNRRSIGARDRRDLGVEARDRGGRCGADRKRVRRL